MDALGDVAWETTLVGSVADAETALTKVAAVEGGDVIVAGQANYGVGGLDYVVARLDAKGKQLWVKPFGSASNQADRLTALAVGTGGTLALGGTTDKPAGSVTSPYSARLMNVMRLSAVGDVIVPAVASNLGQTDLVSSLLFGADGALYATIAGGSAKGIKRSELRRLAADGSLVWSRGHFTGGQDTGHYAVLGIGDGELMTVHIGAGATVLDTATRGVTRFKADGTERWSQLGPSQSKTVAAIAADSKHIVIVDREEQQKGNPNVRVSMVDAFGNEAWFQNHDSGAPDVPTGATLLSDGGVVVVGGQALGKGGEEVGQLWRLDRWGHKACGAAGACATVDWKGCNDGKTCTADACDPKLGCTATPINGLHCDPVNGCSKEALCGGGTCKPSANGRIYTRNLNLHGLGDVGHDVAYSDGKISFVTPSDPGSTQLMANTCNDALDIETSEVIGVCSDVKLNDVHRGVQAKSLWSLWGDATGTKAATLCVGVGLAAKKHALPVCAGCGVSGVAVAVTIDGGGWALTHETLAGAKAGKLHRFDKAGNKGPMAALPWCGDGTCALEETATNCVADCAVAKNGSCQQKCGGKDPSGSCQCDTACVEFKDCCADYAAVCQAKSALTPVALAAMPDASALVASISASAAPDAAQLDKVDVAGKSVWSRTLKLQGALQPRAVASNTKGWAAMVGRFEPNAAVHAPAHALLDAAGKTVWLEAISPPDMGEADAVLIETDGGLVMSGWRDDKGVLRPAMWRVDAAGKTMWSRMIYPGHELPLTPRPGQLARAPDGYLVAAASKGTTSPVVAIIRTDLSGFASCVDAGTCAANKADACDDGKPCTADSCHPISGCVFTPVAAPGCGG